MSDRPLPLAAHERFHTHDLDEARAEVGRAFCPHGLSLVGRGARLAARLHSTTFERTGLHYLDYGAEVRITPGELESFFLVQIPLAGAAEVSCGREQIVSTPELASVPSPTDPLSMRWGAGNPQLIVWIDRPALETHLGRLLARPAHRSIDFSLGMDLTLPAARSWLGTVDLLRREADGDGGMLDQPLVVKQFEELLMTQLLLAQPSNYTAALLGEQPRMAPPAVKRAMELIEAHAAEPLTVADIAEAVGVGVRALQEGFRRHLETTPLGYLREVRLTRVRADLVGSDPGVTTVTDVACRWGFFHAGRFSAAYRERFGESPSATLRR
ncbi:AraC family transcriptional regulator [Actinomadura craniellae]|uniref:AraC family transcriptional regulator n=1 Tax=Actinomadura craniellae TaxID=2231787 RepID=A0A365H0G9_9ACTN|nr:AraC family transcriptional regulator [Actinomadura craniellae]RAY12570.1 AraC family transcriptional regulator [Actinomadura craniellae]